MPRQKGKILTFCFSMVPGAGHMYLGFMKQGLSLMVLFALLCSVSMWLQTGPLLLFAPIVWFYSFFDVINKNSMEPEEFYELEDVWIWGDGWMDADLIPQGNKRRILAYVFIAAAVCMIWGVLEQIVDNLFGVHWLFGMLFERLPVLAAAGLLLWLAVHLMQTTRDEEPFFADEKDAQTPYPFVHPPVLHVENPQTQPEMRTQSEIQDEPGFQKPMEPELKFQSEPEVQNGSEKPEVKSEPEKPEAYESRSEE